MQIKALYCKVIVKSMTNKKPSGLFDELIAEDRKLNVSIMLFIKKKRCATLYT